MNKDRKMNENKVSIIVDSGSDMFLQEASELGIVLIPMKVRFGEEEFDDGITLSRDEFYERMTESDVFPKTSQIPPFIYEEYFQKEVDAGNEVVCLTLSSEISGSFQSAVIAASSFEGKVHVVDTRQFCGPEYLLAQRAAQMRDSGMSASDIAAAITEERTKVKVIAVFDTLEYLKKGGRISAAAAGIGSVLSIKPIITISNGLVDLIGKARGFKNANKHIINFVNDNGGIDFSKPLLLSWSGNSDELLKKFIDNTKVLYGDISSENFPRSRVGATIGTYTGPGACALSFYPIQEEK